MLRAIAIAAVLSLAATGAFAQKIDAKGNCHDASGKMAKMEVCKLAGDKAAPNCKKGKPCGKTCIAMDKVCHVK
ncbi:MAG TPA: hypothetical protein VHW05_03715 [Phenylobacterium sp.]|jgi:hypothetical protein|nr:hypothetical protein [Phenylobacterium sp.]